MKKTKAVQPSKTVEIDDDDFFVIKKKLPSPFTENLPPERIWPTAAVTEKTIAVLAWIADCQAIVDANFGSAIYNLHIKPITSFLWITMQSKTETRVFAFIAKATGDIHCPALFDEPFDCAHGNIVDEVTRLSIMGAWGVVTPWSWLPTFAGNKRFSKQR